MRILVGTLVAAHFLLLLPAPAQPPLYMRKAKAIQAEARDMQEKSRSNPQKTPDYTQPDPPSETVPTAKSKDSQAVYKAAGTGQLNELQLLESKGYSLTAGDADWSTPLHVAAYKGQKEIVDYLLSRPGMLKDPVDKRGYTPLMLAAAAGHMEVVESLLAAGCDVHLKCQDGGTALHKAASQGDTKMVDRLLLAGCDPKLADARGKTPAQLAEEKRKGDWSVVVSHLKQAIATQQ